MYMYTKNFNAFSPSFMKIHRTNNVDFLLLISQFLGQQSTYFYIIIVIPAFFIPTYPIVPCVIPTYYVYTKNFNVQFHTGRYGMNFEMYSVHA